MTKIGQTGAPVFVGDAGGDDDERERREGQSALVEEDAYKDDLQAVELEGAYQTFHDMYGSARRRPCRIYNDEIVIRIFPLAALSANTRGVTSPVSGGPPVRRSNQLSN